MEIYRDVPTAYIVQVLFSRGRFVSMNMKNKQTALTE